MVEDTLGSRQARLEHLAKEALVAIPQIVAPLAVAVAADRLRLAGLAQRHQAVAMAALEYLQAFLEPHCFMRAGVGVEPQTIAFRVEQGDLAVAGMAQPQA